VYLHSLSNSSNAIVLLKDFVHLFGLEDDEGALFFPSSSSASSSLVLPDSNDG